MSSEVDFSEFLDVFLQEAGEQLEKLDDGLLRFEREPGNTDILNEIFRAAHTLKGSSATMGFSHIKELTHDAENLLDALRPADEAARAAAVDALLACTNVLRAQVQALTQGDTSAEALQPDADAARQALAAAMPGRAGSHAPAGPALESLDIPEDASGVLFKITFRDDCQMPSVRAFMATQALEKAGKVLWTRPEGEAFDAMAAGDVFVAAVEAAQGADLQALAADVSRISEIAGCEVVERQALARKTDSPRPGAAAARASGTEVSGSESMQTVRVAVDRLDRLVNLIGEMVVDRTGLSLIESALSTKYGNDESVQSLGAIATHLGRVVGDLHDEIMKMRMLPVGQVFRRFPRMVRDVSQKLGKRIQLVLEGESTGLDRSILEDIVDPITHLLRNAIDHGIEPPGQRELAGKSPDGLVKLSARHEEGHVVIEIEDDGKGVDPEALKNAAVARGVITREAAAKMEPRDAYQLLFYSGVSTASKVTEVSGRGVGMDVVKSNIEKLHGHVDVDSTPGQGTRFSIRLPLTLAIVEALIIRSGGRLYALPLASVVSATTQRTERVHIVNGMRCVVIRDETLPLLSINGIFDDGHVPEDKESLLVVIVQSRGQQAALAVDELVGKMDIVVKSLGAYLGDVPGFSGAAILGDGHIALIIDIASLLELVRQGRAEGRLRATTKAA